MSDPAAPPPPDPQGDAPAPAEAVEAARAQIRVQLALLGQLAEAGLGIALEIERQVTAVAAQAPEAGSPETVQRMQALAMAYGRVSRAVRLTVGLQSRLVKDLQELDRTEGSQAHHRRCEAEQAARWQEAARMEQVDRVLERVIRSEADAADADRLAAEAYDRLEHDDIYGDLSTKSLREIVTLVCHDLGISPDWDRWEREAWTREPAPNEPPPAPRMTIRWLREDEDEAAAAAEPQSASP